ncbi:hypothetical protein [Falsiruegeria litorea]|uniref:hypothetical protein n=1 Tax=Falsiruegeria litorea TaxID=1280831 RepID=UPI001BFDA328|nr:hypothetical protein [Falsiruegeria litorea]MBT8167600.1 hypothetical protein [Falsiruegeria litorea]
MTNTKTETVFLEHGPIRVTDKYLTTRFKDEALAPIQSVQIGRDPLWMAGIMGLGLVLFANRFGDLLFWHEQMMLVGAGVLAALAGYCVASLQIGQHMQERTVLWAPLWTVVAVRKAISQAKHASNDNSAAIIISEPAE